MGADNDAHYAECHSFHLEVGTSGATHRYYGTGQGKENHFIKFGVGRNRRYLQSTRGERDGNTFDVRERERERNKEHHSRKPPADDGKTLAKRFARGGNRTRDLHHGSDGASYHYITPFHSVFLALTVGAGPKSEFRESRKMQNREIYRL